MKFYVGLCVVLITSVGFAQTTPDYNSVFEHAAVEFNVPADILKSIAFSETRWQHLTWVEGDTASPCNGMPRLYGIMGLWDNQHFGHSLRQSARLIGEDINVVKADVRQNIRAGAALLRKCYDELPPSSAYSSSDLESWYLAIAQYCGIPQKELALEHAYDILEVVADGYAKNGINIQSHSLHLSAIENEIATAQKSKSVLLKTIAQPDYPTAKWVSAYPGTGNNDQHWYTSGNPFIGVVIHYMEGYYLGVISYFQASTTQASAHYCVKAAQISPSNTRPTGEVTQMVEERYWAWHAICLNRYTVGIEHEGFTGTNAWWTPEFYISAANLSKYICNKYSIPKDRNRVIGHNEWQNTAWVNWAVNNGFPSNVGTCNNHTDPGPLWDWPFFMQLVSEDPTPPRVVSKPPTGLQKISTPISISFNQRMEPVSTAANLIVQPSVAGTVAWSSDNRALTFKPSSAFEYNTKYTVSIDTAAHNYLGHSLDADNNGVGGDVYSFSFKTVERDTIPPSLVDIAPPTGSVLPSPNGPINLTFSELLNPLSVILANFDVREIGATDPISRTIQHWTMPAQSGVSIWMYDPLIAGTTYALTLNNIKDNSDNALFPTQPIQFTISPSSAPFVLDNFDNVQSSWEQPSTSELSKGIVRDSTSIIGSTLRVVPVIAQNTAAGSLRFVWRTDTTDWLLHLSPKSGLGATTRWKTANAKLQVYLWGDGSRADVRFVVDDSVEAFPTSQPSHREVSRWIPVNWVGWKIIEWDFEHDTVGTWTGNGKLGGILRFNGIQLRYRPGISARSGQLFFDQLQLIGEITTDVLGYAVTLPLETTLRGNYPNPFNPSTQIQFTISREGATTLKVYDLMGREVVRLVNETLVPGTYSAKFDAARLSSGTYIYELRSGDVRLTKKMMMIK